MVLEVEHSSFTPDRLELERGDTVRFIVENGDPIDHELIIGDRRLQLRHENGTEQHHGTKDGEVSVPAGETAETRYRFEDEGTLIFGCHLPGHYDYGMRGEIRVDG